MKWQKCIDVCQQHRHTYLLFVLDINYASLITWLSDLNVIPGIVIPGTSIYIVYFQPHRWCNG